MSLVVFLSSTLFTLEAHGRKSRDHWPLGGHRRNHSGNALPPNCSTDVETEKRERKEREREREKIEGAATDSAPCIISRTY